MLPWRAMPAAMDTACSRVSARMTFGCTRSASASSPAEAPMRIAASVFASTSWTHSRRSKPLPYPPAIRITGAPRNALNATRPASGVVAFESLYQRTPAHSPTSSSRCATPLKPRIASLMAASVRPAMCRNAAAARAVPMLGRPGRGIGRGVRAPARLQDSAGQRCRGRLAVGAGDADHGAFAETKKQVDLARHRYAFGARLVQELRVPRHAGACVDDIDAVEDPFVVAAHTEIDTGRQLRDGRQQLA